MSYRSHIERSKAKIQKQIETHLSRSISWPSLVIDEETGSAVRHASQELAPKGDIHFSNVSQNESNAPFDTELGYVITNDGTSPIYNISVGPLNVRNVPESIRDFQIAKMLSHHVAWTSDPHYLIAMHALLGGFPKKFSELLGLDEENLTINRMFMVTYDNDLGYWSAIKLKGIDSAKKEFMETVKTIDRSSPHGEQQYRVEKYVRETGILLGDDNPNASLDILTTPTSFLDPKQRFVNEMAGYREAYEDFTRTYTRLKAMSIEPVMHVV